MARSGQDKIPVIIVRSPKGRNISDQHVTFLPQTRTEGLKQQVSALQLELARIDTLVQSATKSCRTLQKALNKI